MVQLVDSDIRTRKVLAWKGVHVLHFMGSSYSRKLRIFLNLKGIKWTSRHVDLFTNENFSPWFLGINPRRLVPVLAHDGDGATPSYRRSTFTYHFVTVPGDAEYLMWHYVEAGSDEPIVLLHGIPDSWYQWHRIATECVFGRRLPETVPDFIELHREVALSG
jgi:Glutathione S-transferase, N-terminal domain